MKKLLLICVIIVLSNTVNSQNIYNLDSLVSVQIPGEVSKIDSLKNSLILIKYHSKVENSEFIAQKELFENDSIRIYNSNLPYDLKSLEEYYQSFAKSYIKNGSFKIESEKLIEKDSLNGYHLNLKDSINNTIHKIEYFLVNKNLYVFEYKTSSQLIPTEKDVFFNSIKLKSAKKSSQFLGKSPTEKTAYNLGYKFGYVIKHHPSYIWIAGGIFLTLLIGIIVFFIKRK
ncbi:hypothetical protein [Lutibacter sp.]|uniref:hypothetical protein n=1 Tax=Lutibacter sp. TaxID=1925666 RepID=UPI0035656158